jgi:hypothetical protein
MGGAQPWVTQKQATQSEKTEMGLYLAVLPSNEVIGRFAKN